MKKMFLMAVLLGIGIAGSLGSPALAAGKCAARGIMPDSSYDGGSSATIHLSGYSYGNTYSVTPCGKRVCGKTSDGTPFSCSRS